MSDQDANIEDKRICDVCGEEMHEHWFLFMDSNGHIPGQIIKENGAYKVVTMTIYETASWREEIRMEGTGVKVSADDLDVLLADIEKLTREESKF